jgi:phage terminase small subunit
MPPPTRGGDRLLLRTYIDEIGKLSREPFMTKPGPRSRPTALKLLHGETHLDRLNLNGPRPRPADPVPPPDASPEVLEVWGAVVAELQDMDTAYASDADSLRCYCEAVVIHRKASALLAQSAIFIKAFTAGWYATRPCRSNGTPHIPSARVRA